MTMMATEKQIHPLFMSREERSKLQPKPPTQEVVVDSHNSTSDAPSSSRPKSTKDRKRSSEKRKSKGEKEESAAKEGKGRERKNKVDKEEKSFQGRSGTDSSRRKSGRSVPNVTYTIEFPPESYSDKEGDGKDGATNESRRKRRKKSHSPASGSQSGADDSVMEDATPVVGTAPQTTIVPNPTPVPTSVPAPISTSISTPVPATSVPVEAPPRLPEPPQAVILSDGPTPEKPAPEKPKTETPAAQAGPKKPVHWFFGAKKNAPKPAKESASGRSSRQASPEKSDPPAQSKRTELRKSTGTSTFGGFQIQPVENRKVFPTVPDAPWPSRELRHVRGLDNHWQPPRTIRPKRDEGKKKKEKLVEVTKGEDILALLAERLHLGDIKAAVDKPNYVQDKFFSVSENIECPQRLLMTGAELQDVVRRRLVSLVPPPGQGINRVRVERPSSASSSDSTRSLVVVIPHTKEENLGNTHPAIRRLYLQLLDVKTPYDEGKCSSANWLQKYAPTRTKDVLQSKTNMTILRDWLARLRVDNVETAESSLAKAEKRKKEKQDKKEKAKRKRVKRVPSDLDGFLADSDATLDEITDPDETGSNCSFNFMTGPREKSKVAKFSPTKNVIIISGPPGCGKTAAVHAVAKELGYSVFELNAGNRRSGKDILDQVGQMSKNHLVHQAKESAGSFFAKKPAKSEKEKESKSSQQQQQQSVILFEEVDLLFEEDKQFWPTITALASESKRPIILTCNDKDLIPIQQLPLHATLEFAAPVEDLAVDYMLTMSALEGHIIERDAILSLYKYTHMDLRNTIAQLQLWCQMGVGDRRSGISWLNIDQLSRDKTTDRRVVSKDTFRRGLGFYPEFDKPDRLPEEEIWRFAWDEYELDLGGEDVGMMRGMDFWGQNFKSGRRHNYSGLRSFDAYADALSAVDVYSLDGMRGVDEPVLETLYPKATEKTIAEELVGYHHLRPLQKCTPTTALNTQMAISVRWLARKDLQKQTKYDMDEAETVLPDITYKNLMQSATEIDWLRWPMTEYDVGKIRNALDPLLSCETARITKSVLATEYAPVIRGVVRFDEHFIREQDELRRKGKRTTRRSTGVLTERKPRGARWWGGVGDIWTEILETGSDDWGNFAVYQEQLKDKGGEKRRGVVDDDEMEGVESG